MQVPSEVRVGPITYLIHSNNKEEFSDRGFDGSYGETLHKQQTIILNPDNREDVMRTTLLHEIFHCVLEQSPLMLSSEEEERVVRAIDNCFLDVMQRNPLVTNYLVGEKHAKVHGGS